MRRIKCQICDSFDIKKNEDGFYECQECNTQYSKMELSRLYVDVDTGIVSNETSEIDDKDKLVEEIITENEVLCGSQDTDNISDVELIKQQTKRRKIGLFAFLFGVIAIIVIVVFVAVLPMLKGFGQSSKEQLLSKSNTASKTNTSSIQSENVTYDNNTVVFLYNEKGKKIKTVYTNEKGKQTITNYTYDSSGSLANEVVLHEGGTRETIKYNKKGLVIKTITYSGKEKEYIEYTYNDKDKIIKERRYDELSDTYCKEYEYDSNDNVVKEITTMYATSTETVTTYMYNNKSQLIKEVNNGTITDYVYDSSGNKMRETTKSASGSTFSTTSYKYDENGNLVYEFYDVIDPEFSKYIKSKSYEIVYTYDEKGNLLTKKTNGDWKVINTYDDQNRIIKEIHYDTDQKRQVTEYIYDQDGKLIKKIFKED